MKSTVKKGSVDVNVKSSKKVESPVRKKGFDYPDADSVASKYGVNEDEGQETSQLDGGLSLEHQMKLAHQQQALVQKLETKNREVERLCTLLEAVEPMPGMDPEKYRRIMENPDADTVDFRDSKIVDLAKKCRKLQLALSKEKANNENLSSTVDKLAQMNDRLERDLDSTASAMSSQFSRNTGAGRTISASNSTFLASAQEEKSMDSGRIQQKSAPQLSKELGGANKKVEDLRRKLQEAEDENKKLTRALLKEVGDGITLEEAVDEGRKGRAQTIVMLKNKIKRLESAMSQGASVASLQTGVTRSTRGDVDAQAEEEIEYMSSARKIAVEELSEAHAKLEEKHRALVEKHGGVKARVRTLETEAAQHKQQMRIVIDKSETDDQLVNALKNEITRLKTVGTRGAASLQANDAMEARLQKATKEAAAAATANMDTELMRLRRLTKQQAEQLATQEQLIKEFRSAGGSSKY